MSRFLRSERPFLAGARSRAVRARIVAHALAAILALGAFGFATPAARTQAPASFRVMTWNIAAGHGDLSKIADVIRDANPDVAALQEVDVHWNERSGFVDQAAALGQALGMDVRFAPIYQLASAGSAPAREFGLAILSRHPIVEFHNHPLARLSTQSNATDPESMPGFPDAAIEIRGVRVRVFTTHLDYRADPRVRRLQVAETMTRLATVTGPVLLMGDLNAPPDAPELAPLFQRLTDAWPAGGAGAGLTYPADKPVRRIDYVLVSSDFSVQETRVLATEASDHRPVVATLTVR